jgi:hypothetical protein
MKKIIVLILLLGSVVVGVAYALSRIGAYRDQAFRADSIAAAADTARLLALKSLDDSTNAWQRRIIQTELQLDSIDRELRQRPVVRIAAGIRVDTIRIIDTVMARPGDEDGEQRFDFSGREPPFGYDGLAIIFQNPPRGVFDVRIFQVDPIPIHARITCGASPGVNTASILFMAEEPFSVVPGRVEQDPFICNRPKPILSFSKNNVVWGGGGLVVGYLLANLIDDGFRVAKY